MAQITTQRCFKKFNASNGDHTCIWCGAKLRKHNKKHWPAGQLKPEATDDFHYGDYADDLFCGLRCGYDFALAAAKTGYRCKAKEQPNV